MPSARSLLTGQRRAKAEAIAAADPRARAALRSDRGTRRLGQRRALRAVPVRRTQPARCLVRPPSLVTAVRRAGPRSRPRADIGVSQSGQSPDVGGGRRGAPEGRLAHGRDHDRPGVAARAAAEAVLALLAGDERAIAATKTYTGTSLALAMLSAALAGEATAAAGQADAVPRLVAALGRAARRASRSRSPRSATPRFVVSGRGFDYCDRVRARAEAEQDQLVVAEPYSLTDLMHGPIAIIEQGFPALVVATSGRRARRPVVQLLDNLDQRRRTPRDLRRRERARPRAIAIRLPSGVPEWLSPLVAVVRASSSRTRSRGPAVSIPTAARSHQGHRNAVSGETFPGSRRRSQTNGMDPGPSIGIDRPLPKRLTKPLRTRRLYRESSLTLTRARLLPQELCKTWCVAPGCRRAS